MISVARLFEYLPPASILLIRINIRLARAIVTPSLRRPPHATHCYLRCKRPDLATAWPPNNQGLPPSMAAMFRFHRSWLAGVTTARCTQSCGRYSALTPGARRFKERSFAGTDPEFGHRPTQCAALQGCERDAWNMLVPQHGRTASDTREPASLVRIQCPAYLPRR